MEKKRGEILLSQAELFLSAAMHYLCRCSAASIGCSFLQTSFPLGVYTHTPSYSCQTSHKMKHLLLLLYLFANTMHTEHRLPLTLPHSLIHHPTPCCLSLPQPTICAIKTHSYHGNSNFGHKSPYLTWSAVSHYQP